MMLTPCWPSAGPTGGAGLAAPAGTCSLMSVRTLRAIAGSNLLDLVEADLDRGLPTEDRHEDLELSRVLVDLRDLAGEVGQRTGDDLDRLADRELRARARALGGLAVEQAVDLALVQRNRVVGRANEPGHAGRVLHELPGVVGEVHVHEQIAGHGALLLRLLLPVLDLLHLLGGDDDLADAVLLAERDAAVLKVLL